MQEEILSKLKPGYDSTKKIYYWKFVVIILSILILISCLSLIISFSKSCSECSSSEESIDRTEIKTINEQKTEVSSLGEYKYLIKEFNLLRDVNGLAESQLFGFKINSFHKDWECLNANLNYNSNGIDILCQQKQCFLAKGVESPNLADVENSQECLNELENREYAQSVLSSFKINVSPIYLEEGQILGEVENFNPNKSTPKGRSYSFRIIESNDKKKTSWLYQYEIIFYSPKKISDSLSNYVGTFYGSDEIYAKYLIVVDVYYVVDQEKNLSEKKFISLIEKMIDSIEFLDQPNNI